jgi:hypothetical protein
LINGKHSTKMGADKSAENTPNAPNLSVRIVCLSPKVWDFDERRLHQASGSCQDSQFTTHVFSILRTLKWSKCFLSSQQPQCVLFLAFLDQHRNLRKVLHFPFSVVEAKIIYEPKTHFWLPPMSAENSHNKPKLKISSENYLREEGMY